MLNFKRKKGFTIIELIVVIAILGILVLLAGPRLLGYVEKAELARIQHDVKVAEGVIGEHLVKEGSLPDIWEDSNLKNSTSSIYDKTGLVTLDEVQDKDYKIVPKEEVSSKLPGSFHANKDGKVYYEDDKTPAKDKGLSDDEINDLINAGFIPIASADELQQINDSGGELKTWGAGTKFKVTRAGGLPGKYIQVKDIDLNSITADWTPIGSENAPFRGQFDGNGHKINNLKITRENIDRVGLFGYVNGATITNVALLNIDVKGNSYTGGLVGGADNSTITNSYATGSVTGNEYVGGLVGQVWSSTMTNSYATGSVTSNERVGGLVGYAWNSTITSSYATGSVTGSGQNVGGLAGYTAGLLTKIENSYATGDVIGNERVGGLVGHTVNSNITNSYSTGGVTGNERVGGLVGWAYISTITNSYATGSVIGNGYSVGGLVGYVSDSTKITNSYATGSVTGIGRVGGLVGYAGSLTKIENSYATGSVTGSGQSVGGLVGDAYNSTITNSYATGSVTGASFVGGLVGEASSSVITNSYWDLETTGQTSSRGGGVGKNTNEMKNQSTYEGWDFKDIWDIDEGQSYPYLRNNPQSPLPGL